MRILAIGIVGIVASIGGAAVGQILAIGFDQWQIQIAAEISAIIN